MQDNKPTDVVCSGYYCKKLATVIFIKVVSPFDEFSSCEEHRWYWDSLVEEDRLKVKELIKYE